MFPFSSQKSKPKPKPSPPKPLELNLPKSWNHLTVEQIEHLCGIMIDAAKEYTKTGKYSQSQMLTSAFMYLSGLEPMTDVQEDEEGVQYFEVQYSDMDMRRKLQTYDGNIVPIRISLPELTVLTTGWDDWDEKRNKSRHNNGMLEWILKPSDLTNFPYPTLHLPDPQHPKAAKVTFEGPAPMMDGTSWRQYRFSADLIGDVMRQENILLRMQQNQMKYGSNRIAEQDKVCKEARARYLANIFNREVKHINPETGQQETSFYYVSTQCMDNERFFHDVTDIQFQAISLWWQGMMKHLSYQYPKVFKSGSPDKGGSTDPLSIYTRSTTTMIKYTGGSEDDVNRATYTIILQHINDMADENDRVKEMQSKYKH